MRLTPVLAMMILVNDYLVTLQVADGGSSESAFLNYSVIPCRHFWWSAVLHLQNYVNTHEMVRSARERPCAHNDIEIDFIAHNCYCFLFFASACTQHGTLVSIIKCS